MFCHWVARYSSFSIPNVMAIFRRGPSSGGIECTWGRLKSRFLTNIWFAISNCCTMVCISQLVARFLLTAGIGHQAPYAISSHGRA